MSITEDGELTDCISQAKPLTGEDDVDIENLLQHMLDKASLYDRKDSLLKHPRKGHTRNTIVKATDVYRGQHKNSLETNPDDAYEYHMHKTHRAYNRSRALLLDHIYSQFDKEDKIAWRGISKTMRSKIIEGY